MGDFTTPRIDGVSTGELSGTKSELLEAHVHTNGSGLEAQMIVMDYALERKLVRKLDLKYVSRIRLGGNIQHHAFTKY
jgi:hypothetical protein